MEKISEIFREKGIKVTPQRLHVFSFLREIPGHVSVDDVYRQVKESLPSISQATVYAILEYFRNKGLVKEVYIDCERILYELRIDGHHHFLCKECKAISDIDIALCPTLQAMEVKGHTIDDFHGYFYGTCSDCKKEMAKKEGTET